MWRFGSLVFLMFPNGYDAIIYYVELHWCFIDKASLYQKTWFKDKLLKYLLFLSAGPCEIHPLVDFTVGCFFPDSPAFPKPFKEKVWSNLMHCFNQHVSVSVMLLSGSGCCTRRSSAWEPQIIAGTSLETWIIRTKFVSRWIRVMSRWWCLVTMVSQKGILFKEAVSFHLGFFQVGEIS